MLPFVIFALAELILLFFLYVAPRQPFNVVLAPPIKAFWGDKFLHYPANFLLLPKLSSLVRNFLSCILGSLLTGWAVVMAAEAYSKKRTPLFSSLKSAFKKYFALFTIVLIITVLFFYLLKLVEVSLIKYFSIGHLTLLSLKPQVWLGPILIAVNLAIVVLIQGMFVYSIPLLMIDNQKLFIAIGRSVVLFFKLFAPTAVLVFLPLLFYIPVITLQFNTPLLIDKIFPEAVLYVCIAGALVSSLVVDLFITVSTTVLFLQNKE